ncbi:flagellar hook assembly protein FlgD [Acidiphilium sp. AL]|uniref:Basal-body rod modification protein FlgD n=1 Tax=Acidiphilium iwatense TaxID=768198 RepID=A0ABS9DYV6_9PROT|nr:MULTISPECIES: flagellar hook assembly protein FlgD [Acidiphilium]MCF3946514.1 flagellar hook assembly protein FlgD [Acidiphilium iwatense]MCU4160415.1 flagellar hook assembly protein FlgD [Acidiphilium sp. AL]
MTASIASVAYQQSQLIAAANARASGITGGGSAVPSASGGTSAAGGGGLGVLSSNFSSFLNLLMTQLRNQDPSSPMDANQFTSELVQFSQVEQQINTNSSLGQLIQLTQAGDLTQASAMLGSKITAQSNEIPLQNGKASLSFTSPVAGPVAIAIYNSAGQQIRDAALTATQGSNTWNWDGTNNAGTVMPDGAYKVAVIGANGNGSTSALPFTVTGTATGVSSGTNSVSLNLGALSVPFSSVVSVSKAN